MQIYGKCVIWHKKGTCITNTPEHHNRIEQESTRGRMLWIQETRTTPRVWLLLKPDTWNGNEVSRTEISGNGDSTIAGGSGRRESDGDGSGDTVGRSWIRIQY
jgi:hypothetical protein